MKNLNFTLFRVALLFTVASTLNLGTAQTSWATLTENLAVGSPKAIALGNAVTADPTGIDSIHFNPAGLTKLKGRQQALKLFYGHFEIELNFGKRTESRQALLDQAEAIGSDLGAKYPKGFFDDEAYQQTSTTAGVTTILPGVGMTDMDVPISVVGGASYKPPGSKLTFATNAYTPLVAGFNRENDDPGRFIGQRLAATTLTYLSPTIAVEVTDTFSFGAGITFNYAGIGLDLPIRVPHLAHLAIPLLQLENCKGNNPVIDICEDLPLYEQLGTVQVELEQNLVLGYNFGMLWEPTPWLSFGAVFQAPYKVNLEGDFAWENSDAWINFIEPLRENPATALALDAVGIKGERLVKGDATLEYTMPAHFAVGTSLQLTPSIKVNLDYKFTGWSDWDQFDIKLSESSDLMAIASLGDFDPSEGVSLVVPLGLEDTWNLAVGVEYQYNDRWAFRVGVEDRPTSIPEGKQSPLLPLGDGMLYGFGFGYKSENGAEYDVALSYFSNDVNMPGNTSDFGNSEDPTKLIYNPYPGQDIQASTEVITLLMGFHKPF